MKQILFYFKDYLQQTDKLVFSLSTLFIAFGIFANYHWELNRRIYSLDPAGQYGGWFLVFMIAFGFAYAVQDFTRGTRFFHNRKFLFLLILAPALFAWKMSAHLVLPISDHAAENSFWNLVLYWPFRLVILTFLLFFVWRIFDRDQAFYGLTGSGFRPKPYLLMVLIMVPLITLASTQPDFLLTYPKLKNISYLYPQRNKGWYAILYELSYGSDFISIELFFRGFLILSFARWAGRDAILPMAVFYCTIHFGKPAGECISSFFGGLLLGIITYNTRSILGGLIVHLGIAWLMELGGYLGHLWK